MAMNGAEELSLAIKHALPSAIVSIDAPAHDSGRWWIDVTHGARKATVEWRPKQGFGVGLGAGGYGEGPDVVLSTAGAAMTQVLQYLSASDALPETERTVLVASGDYSWRTAIQEQFRIHCVWADFADTLTEAYARASAQSYAVVVIDAAAELSSALEQLRNLARSVESLVITVATADDVSALDDAFDVVMNKRMSAENVTVVVQSLIAASGTTAASHLNSESA